MANYADSAEGRWLAHDPLPTITMQELQGPGAEGASPPGAGAMSFSMRTTVYGIKKKFPSVRNISCQELDTWRREGGRDLVLLDTRPVEEYQVSHIPHSVMVDPEDQDHLHSLGISEKATVVCYCSVGYRSSSVAKNLFKLHKHSCDSSHPPLDVYNLEGGVFQWACEGRDLLDGVGDKVTTVHPYSSYWGLLLPANLRQHLQKSKV